MSAKQVAAPDLEELLWRQVNLLHRAAVRTERLLGDREVAQHRLQRKQDGSEVKSSERQRLTAEGTNLVERRHCPEAVRDRSAKVCELHTGSTWRPRSGPMVNHRHLTTALIDVYQLAVPSVSLISPRDSIMGALLHKSCEGFVF
jgi:hypothetical protein